METEILEHGHGVGQRQAAIGLIEFQAQARRIVALAQIKARAAVGCVFCLVIGMDAQGAQAGNVFRGLARAEAGAVGGRKVLGKTHGESSRPSSFDLSAFKCSQFVLDRLAPAAQQGLQLVFERSFVGRACAVANVEHEAQHGKVAAFDLQAPVEQARRGVLFQQRLDLQADLRRQHVAR